MSCGPVPRYCPELPFPPYAHEPGRTPHPGRDPAGHGVGLDTARIFAVDPNNWAESAAFLYGIDLFNAGFPWEAHEAWEDLWRCYDANTAAASMLEALIKLAAASVKASIGNAAGVRRHLAKAAALLATIPDSEVFGLYPMALRRDLAHPEPAEAARSRRLPLSLWPGDGPGTLTSDRPPRG